MEQKIQDRKEYVDSIRQAFHQNPEDAIEEYGDFVESPVSFYFKIRIFIALFAFLGFAFCDQIGGKIYSYTTNDIVSAIESNQFQEQYDTVVLEVTKVLNMTK